MDQHSERIQPLAVDAERVRAMARAELMGSHTHATIGGVRVHVWRRAGRYLARGRYQGQAFGETLGATDAEATSRLRIILVELENGSYVRPREARRRLVAADRTPLLTLRQLVSEFLAEKCKLRGRRTADNYRARLGPVLDFAEQPEARRRWPLAADVDRAFAVELRGFLHRYKTTRNGRAGGTPRVLAAGQIVNVLGCLRTMLGWAARPDVRKLPVAWANPLTPDLVGQRPAKDPLRAEQVPLDARVRLVALMDRWQLCHLALSLVLPLRPGEAAGLLVSDVDFECRWLAVGTRLGGSDFTKARTSFKVPFPSELGPVLQACVAGRAEGPLLRSRTAFDGGRNVRGVASVAELDDLFQQQLTRSPARNASAEQDRKRLFRRLLRDLGGVTEDQLARECKALFQVAGVGRDVKFYALRGSVSTAMARAGVPHLELRYLTSHAVSDIMNTYVGLDPVAAMAGYFVAVRPLLRAIEQRARELGFDAEGASARQVQVAPSESRGTMA